MYKNYTSLNSDRLAYFGGIRSIPDFTGSFCIHVSSSLAGSGASIGSRFIMFGD